MAKVHSLAESFRLFGLSPDASFKDVKSAYKEMIKVWHPDRFTEDTKLRIKAQVKTQEINQAFQDLKIYLNGRRNYAGYDESNESTESGKLVMVLSWPLRAILSFLSFFIFPLRFSRVAVGLVVIFGLAYGSASLEREGLYNGGANRIFIPGVVTIDFLKNIVRISESKWASTSKLESMNSAELRQYLGGDYSRYMHQKNSPELKGSSEINSPLVEM